MLIIKQEFSVRNSITSVIDKYESVLFHTGFAYRKFAFTQNSTIIRKKQDWVYVCEEFMS